MTETINGYPIIKRHATPAGHCTRPGAVILVERDSLTPHPFVTAWTGDGDSHWCWGHYFEDRTEAEADFDARTKRGY